MKNGTVSKPWTLPPQHNTPIKKIGKTPQYLAPKVTLQFPGEKSSRGRKISVFKKKSQDVTAYSLHLGGKHYYDL